LGERLLLKKAYLAILQGSGVQRHSAVREERLNLGYEQVAFFEKVPHLQFIAL